jgi:hypothetical protein
MKEKNKPGQGRKLKYNEETITKTFRFPKSKKNKVILAIKKVLDSDISH